MDSLLAQGVDAIILSEPVEDGDEPLVADVPVLTFGTAPAGCRHLVAALERRLGEPAAEAREEPVMNQVLLMGGTPQKMVRSQHEEL